MLTPLISVVEATQFVVLCLQQPQETNIMPILIIYLCVCFILKHEKASDAQNEGHSLEKLAFLSSCASTEMKGCPFEVYSFFHLFIIYPI